MTFARRALMLTAAGVLTAQPCAAAMPSPAWGELQMFTFAGLNVKVALGNAKASRPSGRLQLTTSYHLRDASTGSVQTLKTDGLEIGTSARGAPKLYLNGQDTAEMREKLRLSGPNSDTTSIVLAVALVVVGVVVIANLSTLSD